eukprot:195799_1
MLSSEGGRDMTQDDMEDDREGSESDGSSTCEDEEEGGGRSEMEEGGRYDDDSCNDDSDEVVGSGSESVNGSQSGVSGGSSSNTGTMECDDDEPLPTATALNDEGSLSSPKSKNSGKFSNATTEAIEEEEDDEKPAPLTEPFDDEDDILKLEADVSDVILEKMAKDEKARVTAHARAKRRMQRYISKYGEAEEFPLGVLMVHSLGCGIGISINEDGTQLFPLGLKVSRLESYYGLSSGKKRLACCTLEVLPLAEAKQRNMIDCPCRVSKSGGSCIFSICIEGLQRGEGPRVIVDENLELAWARVLRVLGKHEMAREMEDDVCERLEAKHVKAGKQRQPIDEEEMGLRSQIADLAETLQSARQQAIAYRKLLTVLMYKQQEPIPIISDIWKLPRRQSTHNITEKEEQQSNISTSASVVEDDNEQQQPIFSDGLCIGGFISPSLMRVLESSDDPLVDPHYIFTEHRQEERNSKRHMCSIDELCRAERAEDQELSWKESTWKARRASLDKRKDGNTQRRKRKKRELEEMAEIDYWDGEVKPEKETSGGGGGERGGIGANLRLEKLHERRRQKEMRDQAKEEEKYVRSVKRGLESELTRRRFAARGLVQAVAEMEELRSLTGKTEEVMKEDKDKQKEDEWLSELHHCVSAPSGNCISQNEAPGLQHLTFGPSDVSDLVFVWDFLHVFQNRLSLCRPPPSLEDLSISMSDAEALRLNLNEFRTPSITGMVSTSSATSTDIAVKGKVVVVPKALPTSREAQHSLELLHDVAGSITALLSGPLLETLRITTFALGEGGSGNKGGGINGAGFADGESVSLNSEAVASPTEDVVREQLDLCSWPGLAIMSLLSYAYKEMGVDTYQKNKGNVYMGSPAFIEADRRNGRLLRERLLFRWRSRARMQMDDSASLEEQLHDDASGGLESTTEAVAPSLNDKPPLSTFRCSSPSDVKVTIPTPSVPSCGPETWEFHALCIMDMTPEQVSVSDVMAVLQRAIRAARAEARGGGSNGTVASKAIKPLLDSIKLSGRNEKNEKDYMKVILECKAKVAEALTLKLSTTNKETAASSDLTKTKFQALPPIFRSVLPCKFTAERISGYMNVTEAQHRAAIGAKEQYKTLALASVAALTQAVLEEVDEGDVEVEVEDGEWVPEVQVKTEGSGTSAQVGKSQNVWEIDPSLLLEHARNEILGELNEALTVEGISDSTKRCCRLILSLVLHPLGSPLIERVDPSSNNGYYDMVTRPLALRDIADYLLNAVSRETSSSANANGKQQGTGPLLNGDIVVHSNSSDDLTTTIVADVRHIFANALWFGGAGSRVWECATKLSFIFERLVFDWIVDPKAPSHNVLDDRLCQTCFCISSSAASSSSPPPPTLSSAASSSPSPSPNNVNPTPPPDAAGAGAQGDLVIDANDTAQQLLVCVRCEAKHHIKCAGVKRMPHGDWFCSNCISEKSLRDIDPLVGTIAYLKPNPTSMNEEENEKFTIKGVSWSADEFAYSLQPIFPSSSRGWLSSCPGNPRESMMYVLESDLRSSAFELDTEAIASPSPRHLGIDTPGYSGWGGGMVLPHSGRLPLGLNPLICCQASELDSTNPEFAAVGQAMAVLLSGQSSSAPLGGKEWLAVLSALSQASVGGLSEALSRSLMERETSALAIAKGSLKKYQAIDTPQDVLSLPANLRMPLREDLDDEFMEGDSTTAASQDEEEDDIDYDHEEEELEEDDEEEQMNGGGDEKREQQQVIRKKRKRGRTTESLDVKSCSTINETEDNKMDGGGNEEEELLSDEEIMGSGVVDEPDESQRDGGEDEFGVEGRSYTSSTLPQVDEDGSGGGVNIPSLESLEQQKQKDEGSTVEANNDEKAAKKSKLQQQRGGGSKTTNSKVSLSRKKSTGGTTKPSNPKSQLGRRPPFEDDLLLHAVVDEVSKAIDKVAAKEAMQRVDPTFIGPSEGGGPLTEAAALITSSPTPVMCAYCDLPEIFLCSPFVWSQSWHEALMLRLGTNNVEMVLEMEEDSDYRKNVFKLLKRQLGALGLTPADNANLYRNPFRCVWYPQNSDLAKAVQKQPYDFVPGGLSSLGDDVSVIFVPKGSVIAHDCCARAMVIHRNYSQSKVVLKMRKEAVESAAHMLAGDRTQPVGVDCTGRLYWAFTHRPGHVFIEPGSGGDVVASTEWIVLDSLEDLAMLCLRLDARKVPELELARGILRYNPSLVDALCDDKFMRKLSADRVPNEATVTTTKLAMNNSAAPPPPPVFDDEEERTCGSGHTSSSLNMNNNVEKNGVANMEVEEGCVDDDNTEKMLPEKKTKCCFVINSNVLVRPRSSGGLWYTARVIRCHYNGTYTVSFNGWPQRFNTRVEGSRLSPDDDEIAVDEAKKSHANWLSCVEASGLSVPSGIPGLVATAHLSVGRVNKGCPAPVFRQEDIMSNMLLMAKAALLTIEAALPDGALLRGRGWYCEGEGGVLAGTSVDVDGEEGGRSSWFSENWTRVVNEAQTAEELMEACIILESSISTRWLHGHFEEGLQHLLSPRSIALRFPSFSDVALRVWVIDKAILYDFTTAPPRAAIGRSGRNRMKVKPKGGGGKKKG